MCKAPILTAARNFVIAGMNRHHSTTGKWADVRFALFVERNIPGNDAAHPVAKNARKRTAPFGPVSQIFRIGNVWTTLGPVHFGVGMGRRYLAY